MITTSNNSSIPSKRYFFDSVQEVVALVEDYLFGRDQTGNDGKMHGIQSAISGMIIGTIDPEPQSIVTVSGTTVRYTLPTFPGKTPGGITVEIDAMFCYEGNVWGVDPEAMTVFLHDVAGVRPARADENGFFYMYPEGGIYLWVQYADRPTESVKFDRHSLLSDK